GHRRGRRLRSIDGPPAAAATAVSLPASPARHAAAAARPCSAQRGHDVSTRPLVTAIVAAYNEAIRIPECLRSLQSQSYAPIEIIVVDDGSTDGTADVARTFPAVEVLQQAHVGKARAVNLAANAARGEILLFLDADMYFDRRYVELLVTPMLDGTAFATCHATELVANPRNLWSRCWQARAGLPPDRRVRLSERQLAEGSPIYRALRR